MQGAEVTNSELCDLKAITLPWISKSVDDLRKVLKIYTSYHNYNQDFARDAQDRCEYAWASYLMVRYHQQNFTLRRTQCIGRSHSAPSNQEVRKR